MDYSRSSIRRWVCCALLCAVAVLQVGAQGQPCLDARYLSLKQKQLDSMTQREYDFFIERDRFCAAEHAKPKLSTQDELKIKHLKAGSVPLLMIGYLCVIATVPVIIASSVTGVNEGFIALAPLGGGALLFGIPGYALRIKARSIRKME